MLRHESIARSLGWLLPAVAVVAALFLSFPVRSRAEDAGAPSAWPGVSARSIKSLERASAIYSRLSTQNELNGKGKVSIATMSYDAGEFVPETEDEDLAQIEWPSDVRVLILYDAEKVTDAGIKHLEKLKQLKNLALGCPQLTDQSLQSVRKLSGLKGLFLHSTKYSPAGIKQIQHMPLEALAVLPDDTGEAWYEPISHIATLRNLDLSQASTLTGKGISTLSNLKQLTQLNLCNTAVDNAALREISELRQLENLNLDGTQVTDEGLVHLGSLKRLKKVRLWNTKVSAKGAAALQKLLPGADIPPFTVESKEAAAAEPMSADPPPTDRTWAGLGHSAWVIVAEDCRDHPRCLFPKEVCVFAPLKS